MIDWRAEVEARREALLGDLIPLLAIPSVKDAASSGPGQPQGCHSARALEYMLQLAEKNGLRTAVIDGLVGFAEYDASRMKRGVGRGHRDYIAVLSHLDVVPATGNWSTPPFEPWIRNGRLYARGAIDDKGPAMATLYALKIVKELGLPMKHNVRLIFGIDEETGMTCMDAYNRRQPPPLAGFTPDAVFPIVNAEKGQVNGRIERIAANEERAGGHESADEHTEMVLVSFQSGTAANMVPDEARAILTLKGESDERMQQLQASLERYGKATSIQGSVVRLPDGLVEVRVKGRSAHGMEPQRGINAGLKLASFLNLQPVDAEARSFLNCCELYFLDDCLGERLGIARRDEETKELTVNVGVLAYERGVMSSLVLNIRYPISSDDKEIIGRISRCVGRLGYRWQDVTVKKPHHVSRSHPMIGALQRIYREETGLEPELLSTGGGTYACKMPCGVAFGALFPDRESTAHQPDEYVDIDELMQATAMFARAIYELGNLDMPGVRLS
ncbi:dipeptidase PepV [Paenibacillus chungangensis]|uniref:Dipeptidase PepV n=1 Tax=Paenibacillus chungangensis TaxID=696535 RepID=A0ABW3HKE5_9BACL